MMVRKVEADFARWSSGFTLLELIVTITLISVLVSALGILFNSNFKVYYSQAERSDIKGKAGRAVETMSAELRQAASLTTATATNLIVTFDTDGDGDDDSVQFTWAGVSGNPFNRVSGGATTPLVNSVSSLAFAYYDAGNVLLSFPVTLSQVKAAVVTLTASSDAETFTLRSQVTLRNL